MSSAVVSSVCICRSLLGFDEEGWLLERGQKVSSDGLAEERFGGGCAVFLGRWFLPTRMYSPCKSQPFSCSGDLSTVRVAEKLAVRQRGP